MTYSVPYSFVPGTKAKADEVNANFIDILSKIEETNERIDLANENQKTFNQEVVEKFEKEIDKINATKADLSLSNIDSSGKTLFNNKANAADIDGAWTNKSSTVYSGTIASNTTKKVSLSSYLPNDGKKYEILLSGTVQTSNYCYLCINSDLITVTTANCLRCQGGVQYDSCWVIIPVGTRRYINLITNSSTAGTNSFVFRVVGYRKVR